MNAQNNIAVLYDNGLGVELDFKKAFSYYLLSANQGFMIAQFNLGVVYETGKGVDADL